MLSANYGGQGWIWYLLKVNFNERFRVDLQVIKCRCIFVFCLKTLIYICQNLWRGWGRSGSPSRGLIHIRSSPMGPTSRLENGNFHPRYISCYVFKWQQCARDISCLLRSRNVFVVHSLLNGWHHLPGHHVPVFYLIRFTFVLRLHDRDDLLDKGRIIYLHMLITEHCEPKETKYQGFYKEFLDISLIFLEERRK